MSISDFEFLKKLGVDFNPVHFYGTNYQVLLETVKKKIKAVLSDLEGSSKEYVDLGEEGITRILATSLNATFQFNAATERNSRGHVDLTLTSPSFAEENEFKYIGEAKLWKGNVYAFGGFDQLNNYHTARFPHGFMLLYFRGKECDDKFKEYVTELLKKYGGSKLKKEARFSLTKHKHESTTEIYIDHYAAHIPQK